MKAHTDLEQSKKLVEILPIKSADMWFANGIYLIKTSEEPKDIQGVFPCWSLAALLNVLPSSTLDSSDNHRYRFRCMERYTEWYDNAIDACVAMIERLHKINLI